MCFIIDTSNLVRVNLQSEDNPDKVSPKVVLFYNERCFELFSIHL